jgi:uncharacterized protein (UPF0333 family)
MTFKKYLGTKKSNKAQASLEYFILLAIIALMSILSFTNFHREITSAAQGEVDGKGNMVKDGLFQALIGEQGLNVEND